MKALRPLMIPLVGLFLIAAATSIRAERPLLGRLMPFKNSDSANSRSNNAGPLARAAQGTKRLFNSARNAMPWRKKSKSHSNQFVNGAGRFFRPDLAHQKDDTSLFSSWFSQEEPQKPLTVPDWMAQERPGFERR